MAATKNRNSNGRLRIAIPSDGALYDSTQEFLAACGMPVWRPSPRRYTASIPSINGVEVVYQRSADIPSKVEDGNVDLGLVGVDRYQEFREEDGDGFLILDGLGYGQCELVVAVPDGWADVDSMADLADLAVELRESGRDLRIATKYPRMTQRFFFGHGANYFTLVPVSGTLEAAPAMGYADIIVDITATGVTLRENRLKQLADGTIIASEGCLIGNSRSLKAQPGKLAASREIVERIEASKNASGYYRVTANVEGPSEEVVAEKVMERPQAAGLQGPTVARVFAPDGRRWYAVTVFVSKADLGVVVDHFRAVGGVSVTVSQADYVFPQESAGYRSLLAALGLR
jgi:ATP phosphoribosyltransferase